MCVAHHVRGRGVHAKLLTWTELVSTRTHRHRSLLFITHCTHTFHFWNQLYNCLKYTRNLFKATTHVGVHVHSSCRSTLQWGHFFALWAHVLHIMAWPHGSNFTSTGDSQRKHKSRPELEEPTEGAGATRPAEGTAATDWAVRSVITKVSTICTKMRLPKPFVPLLCTLTWLRCLASWWLAVWIWSNQ